MKAIEKGKNHFQLILNSDLEETPEVESYAEKLSKRMGFSEDERDSLAISITEIVNNAIKHGNKNDVKKKVYIDFIVKNDEMIITVQDEGKGFDVDEIADPLAPENLMKESGRGIYIVRTLMDDTRYTLNDKGTLVRIVLKKKSKKNEKKESESLDK
ncbi:MAG: ATP-binding protein [candidate division KSB1 bacterium]|nr:ATP-binding protein [candidate division KSB1 bacterium]